MPVFLDGQQNLASLTVPGVYGDIILPTPMLLGTPTNIEGLVGVASWGPLNALIPVSKPSDAAVYIGPPMVRSYDISSYVSAATQVGGSVGFMCVRVSDGTDVAATATVQSAITINAKYSGILGNGIKFSIQNGTQVNSYMGVVSFAGMVPEQFNNIAGPTAATGSYTFTGNPTASDTITVHGTSITFVASGATGSQVNIGATLPATLANLLTFLNASADSGLVKSTYGLAGSTLTVTANQSISSGANAGTSGNALTLAKSSTAITLSGATLAGGAGTWQTFWTNLANAINNGTSYHGASIYVTATALVSTAVPTLSTAVSLSGGTDGASGVTDATLIGQDIVPRKGMYALRNSNCDGFTLCDLSSPSYYASIVSFALSETMLAVQATASGDTIANALSVRVNSGIDSPWLWLLMGDWPTFSDSVNASRLISPAAFGIGIIGNLSPQQSPLNKPLQGVSSTQRSTLGQTYSDTELSIINTGGIDTILPPSSSPGGYYYSFATGRNASSNTAANGVEYTRMTNFLIRAAQSKAAGSFVGQLQSIQPTDQTRANAKSLFDGFSAQLASSQVGLGIGGVGMIDMPWLVQCDLDNNPPNLQALGYLFLYWQVRYLNVIRYFVVKFQGGGNVSVNVQSSAPSPSQFSAPINTVT